MVSDDQPGHETVVPGPGERKDQHHQQGRLGQGQHDLPERSERPGAVDAGCILQFMRQAAQELPEDNQQYASPYPPAGKGRDEQWEKGIEPIQLVVEHELRNHDRMPWHDDRKQQKPEDQVPAGKTKASETIPHHGAHERLAQRGQNAGQDTNAQALEITHDL